MVQPGGLLIAPDTMLPMILFLQVMEVKPLPFLKLVCLIPVSIFIFTTCSATNSNYGELYYSHDYGVTFNKWVTSEAQTVITGTGQISCSGSGKYVYIAGTNASSAFVYYRSTDYGISFNKDITKFPGNHILYLKAQLVLVHLFHIMVI